MSVTTTDVKFIKPTKGKSITINLSPDEADAMAQAYLMALVPYVARRVQERRQCSILNLPVSFETNVL